MILISLIVSAVAIIYFLIGITDNHSRTMQILQLNILCIAFLTIVSVTYQFKISTYIYIFKTDYDLYQIFYGIRIPVRILSILHTYGTAAFLAMSVAGITFFGNTAKRIKCFLILLIPLIFMTVINMPGITWKLFLYEQTNDLNANPVLSLIIKSKRTLSKSIVIIYLILPFIFFIKDHSKTNVGIKKNKIRFVGAYLFFINLFFYAVFVRGIFRHIIFFNTNESMLPIDTVSTESSYSTQILYLAFAVSFVAFLIFQYIISSYRLNLSRHNLVKRSDEIDKRSNMLFHIYKNAFIGIQRQGALVEHCIKNKNYDAALKNSEYCCEIAKAHLDMLNKSISMLYKITPNITAVNFYECIEDAVKRVSVPNNIKLIYDGDFLKYDFFVKADKYYLTEVIINLIINSVTSLDKKGSADPTITFCISYEYDYGILRITDNGIGVSEENIKKIFSLFYSTDYNKNHSGIGLYYAKKIISQMHGEIIAESEPEKYFTTKIALPIYKKHFK